MAFIEWNDRLATHIKVVDEEHKFLIENLNVLYEVSTDRTSATEERDKLAKAVLENLGYYIHTHFVVEEELMRVFQYPGIDAHKAEHKGFTDKITYLSGVIAEGGMDISIALLTFLKDWLSTHIMETDAKMGKFLTERGQN